jgi:hypothetical protein
MASKVLSVSSDNTTFYTIPGSTAGFDTTGATASDTIFGQTYSSTQPTINSWTITGNSYYKGYAGYVCTIKKSGTSTAMTGEAMTLVSGKTYQISAATKEIWDRTATFVVYDGGVDHTADVASIDYLYGKVTFASAYTVTGAVTVDGSYLPTSTYGKASDFTLTQTATTINTTDLDTAQANNGYDTFIPGLRTVSLGLNGFFNTSNGFKTLLDGRTEIVIEINPDGAGNSMCRGFFKADKTGQSGAVGAAETETANFMLSVPYSATSTITAFSWAHASGTTLPQGIRTVMDAWEGETLVYVKYLPDGTTGWTGQAVVTDVSLKSGLTAMSEFTANFQGSGAYTAV